MTQDSSIINSEEYWDKRFRLDWEEKGGREQSRFFADLAIKNLPEWLIDRIRHDKLSVADWGCAFGDGTDVLADCFGSDQVTGVDFSEAAIRHARQTYSDIVFHAEDWLEANSGNEQQYDIVFSSNTLEHFRDPFSVLRHLCKRSKGLVAAIVPYREMEPIDEHFCIFLPENIPVFLEGGFHLVWCKPVDCNVLKQTCWNGEQIVLVYARADIIERFSLMLAETRIEIAPPEPAGLSKSEQTAVLEENDHLRSIVSNQDNALAELRIESVSWRHQASLLETRLDKVLHSTSWRVTFPFRMIGCLLRLSAKHPELIVRRFFALRHFVRSHSFGKALRQLVLRTGISPAFRGNIRDQSLLSADNTGELGSCLKNKTEPSSPYIKDLVSIVLPVYNQANYLADAIDAITRQTYENWELIIVNDGSTDNFDKVVEPYRSHPKIRIANQPNQQLPSALNNGFREARGEYFTWTSADNIMLPNQLTVLAGALRSNPSAGLAYSDYTAIDDLGNELSDPAWRQHNRPDGTARLHLPREVTIANFHNSGDNFLGASFLWRAQIHDIVGAHDENTFGGEDYDFWLRMSLVTPFVHVPENLYLYRVHDNTLNARAKELKISENVRRLLSLDGARRKRLLKRRDLLEIPSSLSGHLRDAKQYECNFTDNFPAVKYSSLSKDGKVAVDNTSPSLVEIDVVASKLDLNLLWRFDIIVVNCKLAFNIIKRHKLSFGKRLIYRSDSDADHAVQHALALCSFERSMELDGYGLSQKPAAEISYAIPRHIMFAVNSWCSGGMEQVVLDLAAAARQRGIRVTLASCDAQPNEEMRIVTASLGVDSVGFSGSVSQLRSFVRDNEVDLVNYHHSIMGIPELAADGIKTVYTLHNCYIWKSTVELEAIARQLQSVTACIAVSAQVAEYAHCNLHIDAQKLFVVTNGTALPEGSGHYCREKEHGLLPETYRFISVASFNRVKCQNRLIHAFAMVAQEHESARLSLVGEPMDRAFFDEVCALRNELGLADKVTILPGTDRTNVLELLNNSHCFVLPSVIEGCSISLAEATLSGIPAICTDVGSARDVAQISNAIRLIPGPGGDIMHIHQNEMWSILNSDQFEFVRLLAQSMSKAIYDKDVLHTAAADAAPRAVELFSMERVFDSFIDIVGRARPFQV
jgi:O-antigen biosynthesis protein